MLRRRPNLYPDPSLYRPPRRILAASIHCKHAFCEDCLRRDAQVVYDNPHFAKLGYARPKSACYVLCSEHCAALAREHAARGI